MTRSTGIDKAKGGWVVVDLDASGAVGVDFVAELQQMEPRTGWVAIDMPLSFPPSGRRLAEVEARKALGRRASTMFYTPPESVISHDWDWARTRGVSKQMWNLVPFVHEARRSMTDRWLETHPELVFQVLAGARLPPKKTWNGQMERRRLLDDAGIRLPDILDAAGLVAPDDVLDAAACALVASKHPAATVALGDAESGLIWTIPDST